MKEIKTGTILPNGATVLEVRNVLDHRIVLAKWFSPGMEYVTWAIDANGDAYWGHYFNDFGKAAKDFVER